MPSSSLFLRSSATFISVLSLLTAPINAYSSDTYALDTSYSGDTFFDGFDFYTDADKSHGFVTYVDEDTAKGTGLIKSGQDGSVIIAVDSTNTYNASEPYWLINGVGRPSVRITSSKKYNHGLFIADIAHMPGGVCGTWPGFWTLGDGVWPYHGEIDILEGANDQTTQLSALHTASTCSIGGQSASDFETGTLQTTNCTYDVNTGANGAGCGVTAPAGSNSYGLDFNSNNGGVYAMQWTSDYIKIWFWPRGSIPADVVAGTPTPDAAAWGPPTSNFQGDCDLDANFINQQIVFDVTFCGDWAGNTWGDSCAAKTGVSTCAAFVADNPDAFTDMYWDINSVKVYQLAPPTSPPSSTSTPTSSPPATPPAGTQTPCSTASPTNASCPVWTEGHAPPAYLTNLPSSIQAELPAWTGVPPPDWCSYTSWMQSYTSANTVYASCQAKSTGTSSSYTYPTPTGSLASPTGSCWATPTGTNSSSSWPTTTTTPTGTWSYDTSSGAWSAWSSDPVTYIASTTTSSSGPLTTGWAQSSLLAPPMGGDGSHAGTISVGGSAYTWGSATSTDPASKDTKTTSPTSTTGTWGSWSDPSSTITTPSTTSTTSTWESWSDPSSTTTTTSTWTSWPSLSTTPSTTPIPQFTYSKTSWVYDPASSSIYWSVANGGLPSLSTSSWSTSSTSTWITLSALSSATTPGGPSSSTPSWGVVSTSPVYTPVTTTTPVASASSWLPVDPAASAYANGTQSVPYATFTGAAAPRAGASILGALGYVALGAVGWVVLGVGL